MKKCEFDTACLDQVVAALTSIGKGAKSKTINICNRGGKMKMESVNGLLNISRTFPADIKKFAIKHNMAGYISPDDCNFSLPSTEGEHLLEILSDTVSFVKMQLNIIDQRKRVFELAVNELLQHQSKMSASQYAIKLFDIYYRMPLSPSEKYPISVIFPDYYKKMFLEVF